MKDKGRWFRPCLSHVTFDWTAEFVSQLTPAVFFLFRHPWAIKSLRCSTQSGSVKP
ncbi:hypothetical protein Hanom_Chr00s000001g01595921 [Helianthus anomalus]